MVNLLQASHKRKKFIRFALLLELIPFLKKVLLSKYFVSRFPCFLFKFHSSSRVARVVFATLNISVHFLKVLLNREICYEILHLLKSFITSMVNRASLKRKTFIRFALL